MDCAEANSEGMDTEEIISTVKTMLIRSIALNNSEAFLMALEALEELKVGLNWSVHSKALVLRSGDWNTPLIIAAKLGRTSMVVTLIEKGANPNLCSHYEHGKTIGRTALHEASKSGHIQVVDCLLVHGCDVNMPDTRGWAPIHDAISQDNIEIAYKLLENGANPRQSFSIPLAHIKNLAVYGRACLMFSAGPDSKLHPSTPSSFEWNCLSFAANCHQPQLVAKLIQEYFHKDVNSQSSSGKTVLHEAVILPESLNVDKEDIVQNRRDTMEILLKAGVDPNVSDYLGRTALHLFFDHVNLAKGVVKRYSKIVHETIRLLKGYGAHLNVADFSGRTVMHQAAAFGDIETVKILVELGATVTSLDNDSNTPAHVAASHGNFAVLQLLLDCASHAKSVNRHGDTVLHVAIMANNDEDAIVKITETLKRNNADKLQTNVFGETEYDLAVKFKMERLSCLLSVESNNSVGTNSTSTSERENLEAQLRKGARDESDQSDAPHGDKERSSNIGQVDKSRKESDFEDICENAEIPELLIGGDTNVNEYLLKLCHEYRVRSFHMDGDGHCHERCTIAKQTVNFVEQLLNLVAEDDKRFTCEVLRTGSAFEGYRIGKPDEFDYMCELKSLSDDKCEILETEDPGFVRVQVKKDHREEWKMFLSEEGFLDAMKVKCFLVTVLHRKSSAPALVQNTSKLSLNTTSYDSCVICHPFVSTSKAGIKMTIFWRGNVYKFMPIDIVITPAIRFPDWPKSAKIPPSHVLKDCSEVGYHIVPKSEGGDSLLWTLSFSIAERNILQNVSPVQGACYTTLKIIKGQTMLRSSAQRFSHLGFLHTYVLKTKFFEELERSVDSELWQENKLTDRICSVLESTASLLSQKGSSQVESYFLSGHNVIREPDRHFGRLVRASIKTTLRNVVRLLRKEPGSSSETDDDASFTMKFDLDSNPESDDDGSRMKFADPGLLSAQ